MNISIIMNAINVAAERGEKLKIITNIPLDGDPDNFITFTKNETKKTLTGIYGDYLFTNVGYDEDKNLLDFFVEKCEEFNSITIEASSVVMLKKKGR